MNNETYLITGPTGATGSAAISALLQRGCRVRAFTHRSDDRSERLIQQGVDVIYGDLNDINQLTRAMAGVSRAYFCYPLSPGIVQATVLFAQAAKENGIDHIVNMSQVIARRDAASNASFAHWVSEQVFDWSGVPTTHLRPTFFAEWLLYLSRMIREGTIYAPYGSGKCALISSDDQGRVIASILQDPQSHRGQTYQLYGPFEYTFAEMAAIVGRELGRKVSYHKVPFEKMAQAMSVNRPKVARNDSFSGYAETNLPGSSGESFQEQHLREAVTDHDNGLFAGTNDVVRRLTGREPMTIEEFVSKHRDALAPPAAV